MILQSFLLRGQTEKLLGAREFKMSLLADDFLVKSRDRYRTILNEPRGSVSGDLLELVEIADSEQPRDCSVPAIDIVFEDKLVKLDAASGRKPVIIKDPPASLELLSCEEDFSKFSLEALKKLAKTSLLEFPKQAKKPALVALLVDAYRLRTGGGEGGDKPFQENQESPCLL